MISDQNSLLNRCKDCKDNIVQLLVSIPLFIRVVICSTIILYLLNLLIPFISLFLSDIPYYTIYYFQIWRLFTTSFITTNILSIIFSLYFWLNEAVKLEKEIGTTKYMLIFFMNTFCIQTIYCFLMFLLSFISRNQYFVKMKITPNGIRNEGLWPILLCDLTLLCLSNPLEPMRFFFFPCVIKAKYYPFFLFLIFTILSGFHIEFEILVGIGFGFLYHYYFKNKLIISNKFTIRIENSFLFRWMKNKKGFINIGGVGIPVLHNNLVNIRNININRNINNKGGFSAFKGKGLAVGEDKNNNINNKDFNNVNITSNEDIMNSGETKLELNSSNENQ